MYYPFHRPQLTATATASVDCGTRATQMGIDWLSKGQVIRSIAKIREIMNDQDATNYYDWDRAIDELGGNTLGFSGEKSNDFSRARDHMNNGGAVIWAVDYGKLYSLMPKKTGSSTFKDYHAILTVGSRKNDVREWRDFDSLLDGRYKGIPNGPLWAPAWKIRESAFKVGEEVAGQKDKVYSLLLHRDPSVGGIEPGDLLPDSGFNLADVLSELQEIQQTAESTPLGVAIDKFENLLGITGNSEADETTPILAGIAFPQAV